LGDLINKDLLPIEKIIIKEVMSLIYEKNHKQTIKLIFTESQAYTVYKMLGYFDYPEPGIIVIINMIKEQIETQLFKKSESGFELLKQL